MSNKTEEHEKSKIETNDDYNRTLYGSPTIGGFIVAGVIAVVIMYSIFK
ncbi:hypothetical protein [Bacillus sp. M6-12]|nr:hypothetical protein [Bacillus sp. M6-12]